MLYTLLLNKNKCEAYDLVFKTLIPNTIETYVWYCKRVYSNNYKINLNIVFTYLTVLNSTYDWIILLIFKSATHFNIIDLNKKEHNIYNDFFKKFIQNSVDY